MINLIRRNLIATSFIFVLFYLVGAIGFILPYTHSLFVKLTFFMILLTNIGLFIFHQTDNLKRDVLVFGAIYLLGFLIEVIGVKTGAVFGNYRYGDALGLKLLETPLIIGLNWLFLSYVATSIVDNCKLNTLSKIIISSGLILAYDVIVEQVAEKLDFWCWEDSVTPIRNYFAWFIISLMFNSIIKIFKVSTNNPIAKNIFLIQFLFFIVILISTIYDY